MGNTIKAIDLHRVMFQAKLFASNDNTLPMINAVRIEATETSVIAVATDRFVLGASRADYAGEAFNALIDMSGVDTLIRMAKTAKGAAGWREVTIDFVDEHSLEFRFTTGEAMTVRTAEHSFPKWRQLLPGNGDITDNGPSVVGYNAGYLAKFAKIQDSRNMRVFPRDRKPSIVTIGADFVGLIMPVRIAEETQEWSQPAWMASA